MLRVLNVLIVSTTIIHASFSQIRKVYSLENNDEFNRIVLFLKATDNSCFIKPTDNSTILSVFSHSEDSSNEPRINTLLNGHTDFVHIEYNRPSDYFMTSMTYRLFKNSSDSDNRWDYYLSDKKPMQLNLDYAIGNAVVDLSSLPVERLMIRTGNADVKVEYREFKPNLVNMDTLFAKVDMGSLTVNRVNYSKAKAVIADVVFGGLFLNYTGGPDNGSYVKASVGAGTLIIGLPESARFPIKIIIHDSPLCHVKIPDNFLKHGKNEFVNEYYAANPYNSLTFDLDVALGHIHFVNQ